MENYSNKSRLLMTASALALVAVGVLVIGGRFSPSANQTSGTIVAADRYRNAQVSNSDVKLGDQSVAKAMQTDQFTALMNNKNGAAAANASNAANAANAANASNAANAANAALASNA